MYCRMCVDVHGLTPTKLNQPAEAEYLVSPCYQADLRHKHEENQGFVHAMCGDCVDRIKANEDIYVFSIYGKSYTRHHACTGRGQTISS